MSKFEEMDAHRSYQNAQKKIEEGFKNGQLSREQAHKISKEAQKNYSNNSYNKEMERLNK